MSMLNPEQTSRQVAVLAAIWIVITAVAKSMNWVDISWFWVFWPVWLVLAVILLFIVLKIIVRAVKK